MSNSLYSACKGLAYQTLTVIASCDHPKAKSNGYVDGWQMLLDKHDENEMALFCANLPQVLSQLQCKALLDGLAQEYTEFPSWPAFADACADHPNWKPSQGSLAEYVARG